MTSLKPAKGFLLVAEPSIIGDISFNRSVVLLAEFNRKWISRFYSKQTLAL